MERIKSRDELALYILRQLGHPVIQVNVSPEQVIDRINDALQKYYEVHTDGTFRDYIPHKVTADDIANGFIEIDERILTVTRLIDVKNQNLNVAGNLTNQMYISDMIKMTTSSFGGSGSGNIYTQASFGTYSSGYGQMLSNLNYMKTVTDFFKAYPSVRFVKYGHKVKVDAGSMKEGELILMECYIMNLAEEYPHTYDDIWVKAYATALVKKQWGTNLSKYNGFELPSGMTIDGSTILNEANTEIKDLLEELRDTWEEPILPLIG